MFLSILPRARRLGLGLSAAALILAGCEKVTIESYDAVQVGMAYSQVRDILGEGEEQSGGFGISADGLVQGTGGNTENRKTYIWKSGSGGGEISVTFVDGKVVDKAKAGL